MPSACAFSHRPTLRGGKCAPTALYTARAARRGGLSCRRSPPPPRSRCASRSHPSLRQTSAVACTARTTRSLAAANAAYLSSGSLFDVRRHEPTLRIGTVKLESRLKRTRRSVALLPTGSKINTEHTHLRHLTPSKHRERPDGIWSLYMCSTADVAVARWARRCGPLRWTVGVWHCCVRPRPRAVQSRFIARFQLQTHPRPARGLPRSTRETDGIAPNPGTTTSSPGDAPPAAPRPANR